MIISKDLFIFGEHIFATIIPEVAAASAQQIQEAAQQQEQHQQQQQQSAVQQVDVATVVLDEKVVDTKKLIISEQTATAAAAAAASKALSKQETVAVVIAAAAVAAAAAASVAATTTTTLTNNNNNNLSKALNTTVKKKEGQQKLEIIENNDEQQPEQQRPSNIVATCNGRISAPEATTSKAETGINENKKPTTTTITTTLQKKAKEEVHNLRAGKKLLVVAAAPQHDLDDEEEEALEKYHQADQRPLVQRKISKLKIISSQQQNLEENNCSGSVVVVSDVATLSASTAPLATTTSTINDTIPTTISSKHHIINNLSCEDSSLNMHKVMLANNTRNEHAMAALPFISKNQEHQNQHRTIQLTFQNINFSHGDRKILSDISGLVNPGEVLAIMGPSGSGKTTLLDCLSGQRRPENGNIFLNREPLSKKWRRKICYVLQEEIFFSGLTLRETVMYTAMLRLPEKMSKCDKVQLVDRILQELELKACEQTKFGDYLNRGLSGGEKKRANIACELLTNPLLMLLDEPTSGLDSHSAISLMRVLKRYATQERKSVVISVHQPSSQMFHMFDKLLLLYNGRTAFFGEVKNIYRYFEDIGVAIKPHYNPADFLLEQLKSYPDIREKLFVAAKESHCNLLNHICITLDTHTQKQHNEHNLKQKQNVMHSNGQHVNKKTQKHDALINDIINNYYNDHHHINHDTVLIMDNSQHNNACAEEDSAMQQLWCSSESNFSSSSSDSAWLDDDASEDWLDYPTSFCTQLSVLSSRSFKEAKPRMLSTLNWCQTIGLALMAGAIWFQLPRTEEFLHDLQGWMFFSQTYWMLFALFGALNSFPSEREVISKERRSGAYRLSAYYLAKMFAELPLVITLPTVYLIISYPMLGCSSIKLFFLMLIFLLLNTIVAQSVGFFIGAYCMDMNVSITLSALYTLATQLFGGYLSSRIPEGLSWIRYTSMIHYAYQNMQILEFREGPKIKCGNTSSYEICKYNATNFIPYEDILKAQNSTSPLWLNTMILMMFFLVFRCLGYAVLRYIRCPKAT